MARRIEIELTSARPDGTWTWRAAGALKPRGVLDGALLYPGAKAGDLARADADFEIEGITVVAVLPPKEKKRAEPERLEVIGPPRADTPGVTTSLTGRSNREADGDRRGPRRSGEAGSGRTGPGSTRPDRLGGDRAEGGGSAGRDRPARPRREGGDPGARPAAEERRGGGDRPRSERRPRSTSERSAESGPGGERGPADSAARSGSSRNQRPSRPPAGTPGERPKPRRLSPGNTYRTAVLATLPPEHQPIAEQVLRGGIPAVRTAIHLEGEKAAAEGRPAPNAAALLSIAEELLPRLKAAEWRDRAEAADKLADELPLRELRSLLEGAQAARDDESRHLAAKLRETLERRGEALRVAWIDEIRTNIAESHLVRALRLSARPPDPATRLPADLAAELTEAAGKAMTADTPADRWAAMLEAVAASPVRRVVKPAGLPTDAGEPLLQTARQQSGRVPALAAMLGISMPPPPGPVRAPSSAP